MTHLAAIATTQPRPSSAAPGVTLAQRLYRALFVAPPARAALMKAEGDRKYSDVKKHILDAADLVDHLNGTRTWAATLGSPDNTARAGVRDYDKLSPADAEARIRNALTAIGRAGVRAVGIVVCGQGEADSGGHVWAFYANPSPVADICAQLAGLPGGQGEVYPSGNAIRLPGGYHRRKLTRGVLIMQDGRRFDLDDAAERDAGLRAMLDLPRNAAPPPAPAGASRSSGGSFGASYQPDQWISLPDGAALMASPRYRALFTARRQLATLQRGERVALLCKDGHWDDTGSAQVAVLVNNLITPRRRHIGPDGKPVFGIDGKPVLDKPGEGAPPLEEIRAVALHWKTALRDDRSPEHYKAQVDYEIARYRPDTYAPEATRGYGAGQQAPTPARLAPAQHMGRPAGQRAEHAQKLAGILFDLPTNADDIRIVTRAWLAAILHVSAQMITLYLADLRAAGQLNTRPARRGLVVLKIELQATSLIIKSPAIEGIKPNNRGFDESAILPVPMLKSEVLPADGIRIGRNTPPPLPDCAACVPPIPASTPPTLHAAEIADAVPDDDIPLDARMPLSSARYSAYDTALTYEQREAQYEQDLAKLAALPMEELERKAGVFCGMLKSKRFNKAQKRRFQADFVDIERAIARKQRECGMSEQEAETAHYLSVANRERVRQPAPVRTPIAVKVEQPEGPAFDAQAVVVVAGKPVEQPHRPFSQVQQPATPRYDAPGLIGRLHALKAVAA